jgi:para-aminobenzoate synthetase component 1
VNAQGLAWAWLNASPSRPFALLETPHDRKRLSLLAGEPLFVVEGQGAKAWLRIGARKHALRLPPEQAFARLGKALAARRGGAAWWPLVHALGYEAGRRFERLPAAKPEPVGLPDWWAMLPGAWLAWNARAGGWLPQAGGISPALARGLARALGIHAKLFRDPSSVSARLAFLRELLSLRPNAGAPVFRGLPRRSVRSNAGAAGYAARVRKAQAHIRDGDIYQANLSHRLSAPARVDAFQLYRRLIQVNPAPMAAYVDLGSVQVCSASPERFVTQRGRSIETWPIAGTAPKRGKPGERAVLRRSAKDSAEHIMLVDLERNDLGRVSVGGSVRVPKLKTVQSFAHVHHLVSQVTGTLKPGLDLSDVYAAAFPGGSITGAPKIRCMEIITALEREARGWYTGCLGWWEPRVQQADVSILIRTIYLKAGTAYWPVGAGIVADSKPKAEWRETLSKAKGLEKALFRSGRA